MKQYMQKESMVFVACRDDSDQIGTEGFMTLVKFIQSFCMGRQTQFLMILFPAIMSMGGESWKEDNPHPEIQQILKNWTMSVWSKAAKTRGTWTPPLSFIIYSSL